MDSIIVKIPLHELVKLHLDKVLNEYKIKKLEKKLADLSKNITGIDIIKSVFKKDQTLHLSEIYERVSKSVGIVNLTTLAPYVDILSIEEAKKRQQGAIRSLLEEHSADSRQHYVKGNIFYPKGVALNCFSNVTLRKRNEIIDWKISSSETKEKLKKAPKKDGFWTYTPSTVKLTDLQIFNIKSELITKKKGMRNH
jgi:hypothetical protein